MLDGNSEHVRKCEGNQTFSENIWTAVPDLDPSQCIEIDIHLLYRIFRIPDHPDTGSSGYRIIRIPDHPDTGSFGYRIIRIPDHPDTGHGSSGYRIIWIPDHPDTG